jgi:predicted Fe-S protein YdhL (DUF1289 family)
MANLSNYAAALGKHGAKTRWSKHTEAERKAIMRLVREAKAKRPPAKGRDVCCLH